MGIFDNATSVVIGNKEVQSIVRVSDGAVLYQKAASHSYALAFSSASYQTDSSGDVTVYVTLTDNGVPVSGETVNFSDATSVYTGNTNNNGVATLSYHCEVNKTITASYSNASATCNVTSNYVPPTPITWNLPLTSYTLTDPDDIIGMYGEPIFRIIYFDSYIDNYEDFANYDYSDINSLLDIYDSEYLPVDLTDVFEVNNEYWVNPIIIYLENADVYLLCSYELIDEDTLVAKITNNIFEE